MSDIGKKNKRVAIQTRTVTYNSYNEPIESWADTATVWAGIINSGGGEFYAAQKLNADTQAVISIRFYSGLTTLNRIKYGSRIFEILHVNDVNERHREMLLAVKEVV